jgi:peptidyl-prolyl cis-trans isomerase D
MMMKMRQKLTWVMGLLVAAFVFTIFLQWGAGGAGVLSNEGYAGKIGDLKLSRQDFDLRVRQALQNYKDQTGNDYPDAQIDLFRKQVWEQLVTEYVIKQELEHRQIASTDSEFLYTTYNDPMPQLKNNPSLQTNGVFDVEKFKQIVAQNTSLAYQLDYVFRTSYPQRVMQFFVDNSQTVSEAEVLETYRKEKLAVNLRYIGVQSAKLPTADFETTDDEIAAYYNENKETYKEDEKRKIEYIRLDVTASVEDTNIVVDELEDIKNRILTDELVFSDEARIESEDKATVDNGGETGMVARGTYSTAFEEALLAAGKNQIVGPIFEGGRFVIAQLVDATEDSINFQHIVKVVAPGTTTLDNYEDLAAQAVEAGKEASLSAYAAENDLNYNETAFFVNNGNIPGIGRNAYLNDFIFKKDVDAVSREVRTNQGRTIFVAKIVAIQPAGYKDLESLKPQIKNIILSEKKSAKAKAMLAAVKDQLSTSTFAEVANSNELKSVAVTDTTGMINYYDKYIRTLGKSPELVKFIMNASPAQISDPIETTSGAYIVEVIRRVDFNQSEYDENKKIIRQTLINQLRQAEFSKWLTAAKETYDIELYRLY